MAGLTRIDWNPPTRTLRQFGFIAIVAFGLLAWMAQREVMVFRAGLGNARPAVVAVLLGLGALSLLCSLLAPRLNRFLFVGLSVLAYPIGFVLSHVLLAVLFFGLLAPLGAFLKLIGKDALLRQRRTADTYWLKVRRERNVADYFRQY
jgi:hypothetical protein